jgi:Pyruvate/2-oxoacid:ferredoxin oxidoreductase delta subunit
MPSPSPLARPPAAGRPASDPACAGCPQLGLLRALRRAGVEVEGGVGCDAGAEAPIRAGYGRRAAVTGIARLGREGGTFLAAAERAGARLIVVADRRAPVRSLDLEDALARAGARVAQLDPGDLAGAEARVREALDAPGTVLVSLAPCVRGAPRAGPVAVDASRCNRCGSCLTLACPALSDKGGEGVAVDATACTGCGLCTPLCRSRALAAVPG